MNDTAAAQQPRSRIAPPRTASDYERSPNTGTLAVLAAALALTAVGLGIGPLRFLRHGGAPWVHILQTTFDVWEHRALSDHYFLSFMDPESVSQGRAYIHYSQPWLLLLYAVLQPLRWLGLPYERSQVALCLPHFAIIVVLVVAHLDRIGGLGLRPPKALQVFRSTAIAIALGGLLTLPSFWIPFFRFNPEQYYFVPALAFCHLAAVDYHGAVHRWGSYVALLAIALFAPMFTPFAIVSWLVLWEMPAPAQPAVVSRGRIRRLVWIALVGVASFLLPGLVAHLTPFSGVGSGWRFRTGLDGSQQYFTSMVQAVLAPADPIGRAWHLFQWPLAALGAIAVAAVASRTVAARMLRQLFICWIPFLWAVIVFPQLVSVHPYFFDFHLGLGAAFCLAFWSQRPELEGWLRHPAVRLAVLMGFVALLMTNLIDLARLAA